MAEQSRSVHWSAMAHVAPVLREPRCFPDSVQAEALYTQAVHVAQLDGVQSQSALLVVAFLRGHRVAEHL